MYNVDQIIPVIAGVTLSLFVIRGLRELFNEASKALNKQIHA